MSTKTSEPTAQSARQGAMGKIVRVSSGNFIEMYDFIVYGYYATYIAEAFFPSRNKFASLMLSLMTFGAGYLMRPLGALVLGSYIDRHGRRKGLVLTLLLMAIGTFTMAATPKYASIGVIAPLLVLTGRLLQGLSAGVELGGVSVYLSEIATPGNRGFYIAWQSASQQVAVIFTAAIGLALTALYSPAQMSAWGWRIPFLIGCLIIPVLLWLRNSLEETEAFLKASAGRDPAPPGKRGTSADVGAGRESVALRSSSNVQRSGSTGEVLRIARENWRLILLGMMFAALTTVTFYLITAYTPTFGKETLHLTATDVFLVTLCIGVSNFIWLPVGGWLSDRFGSGRFLMMMPLLCLLTAWPTMQWLVSAPSFSRLLAVELWYSPFYGLYNGAMIPFVIGFMPQRIRTTGFALSYSLATALFGGFTPAMATFLIHQTGNKAAPTFWLSFAAALSLGAAVTARGRWVERRADL